MLKKKKKKKIKRKTQIQHKPFYADIKPGVPKHAVQIYPYCNIKPPQYNFSTAIKRQVEELHNTLMILDDPFLLFGFCILPTKSAPCASCKFYDNNAYLSCAVNPKLIDVDNCTHWEQK